MHWAQGCSPGAQLSMLKHLEQSVRKTQLWSPVTDRERTGPQLLPLAWCPGKTTPFFMVGLSSASGPFSVLFLFPLLLLCFYGLLESVLV